MCRFFIFWPRNFSKEISATALIKLTKLLGFESSVLKDEILDFSLNGINWNLNYLKLIV